MSLRIEARQTEQPSRCVFCHDGPGDDGLQSCDCGATAHRACREDAKRCATIGCGTPVGLEGLGPFKPEPSAILLEGCPSTQWVRQTTIHDQKGAAERPDHQCVGCGGVKPGLYDTTWDGVHIGHLCIGCINTGMPSLIIRRRKNKQEPDQFLRAMALLGAITVLSPFILFFAWWALGVL